MTARGECVLIWRWFTLSGRGGGFTGGSREGGFTWTLWTLWTLWTPPPGYGPVDARGTGTFEKFTQRLFLKNLQVELRKVSRFDIVWDTYRPMSIKGNTHDERGHGVRLKVGPNVRIPGNWSEFLRDSTNKVELFKYLSGEVMQRFHSAGDIYITMSNGTTVGHVGPGEDNRVQPGGSRHTDHLSHQPCSELRILQHSDHDIWLWCDRHSYTSSSRFRYNQYWVQHHGGLRAREDTASHQHQITCMCSGSSTQCGSPPLRDLHWMRLNVRHEGALKDNLFLCKEEVFAPRHKMHSGAAGQPITTFADGCQVWCIRRAVHSDIWQKEGLIDQPSEENDFLSEKPECWNDPPPHHRMRYSNIVGGQCSRQVYGRRPMTQLWSNLIRVFMVGTENTITWFLSG